VTPTIFSTATRGIEFRQSEKPAPVGNMAFHLRLTLLIFGLVILLIGAGTLLSSLRSKQSRSSSNDLRVSSQTSKQPEGLGQGEQDGAESARRIQPSNLGEPRDRRISLFDRLPALPQRLNAITSALEGKRAALASSESASGQEQERVESARGDHPDEAIRFRNLQLQDENGNIPADGLQRARQQMTVMRAAQEERARAAGKTKGMTVASLDPYGWTWLGPGNVGGRIRSIVIDPNNANKMWVGSVSGGIWRSTDAGASWGPVDDFMANLAVSTMVIDPTNSNIMYAGTGEIFPTFSECYLCSYGIRGGGIFKSIDGGLTWNLLANTDPARINPADPSACAAAGLNCQWSYVDRLAISPDGSTILAATAGTTPAAFANGIWRSTDGGANWSAGGGVTGTIMDIDFDPTTGVPPANQKAVASANQTALFSTGGGRNWRPATFNPAFDPTKTGRVELAYAPSNPNIVYASVNQNSGEVYQSIDGGQTYLQMNTGTNFLSAGQGNYDNIIWVNPQDPTFVIVGGIDLWRSTDCGTINPSTGQVQCNFIQISRWQCAPDTPGNPGPPPCSGPSAHADQHMIVAHPAFNNTTNQVVYFSNDGGLFRADDVSTVTKTSGWTSLNNNLGITQFYGGAGNADSGTIMGGAQDNGTVTYTGNAQGWTAALGGDGGFCAADPTDANYFYGEYSYLAIFSSSNGAGFGSGNYIYCDPAVLNTNVSYLCTSPTGITDAGISNSGPNFVAPFVLDPNDSNTMLAGGNSLWRSNDIKSTAAIGPVWTAIKAPVSNGLIPPSNLSMSAIAISPSDSSTILVGYNDGQIWMTQNGAASSPTWSKISKGTPGRFVTRLVIDSTKLPSPWFYATFGGFANDNVYVTKDLGATKWTDVSGVTDSPTDLPAVPVRVLTINPASPNDLYVGTEVGIFASEDAGATWQLPQGGPANVSVDDLFWLKGDLIAVTHGRGMYTTRTPIFKSPVCIVNGSTSPRWDDPSTWGGTLPGPNDDVVVSCPMTVGIGYCRNLTVYAGLTLTGGGLSITEDLRNGDFISGSGNLRAQNLNNVRRRNAVSNTGRIEISGDITLSGDLGNHNGIISARSLTAGGTVINAAQGSISVSGLFVTGNVNDYDEGTISASNMSCQNLTIGGQFEPPGSNVFGANPANGNLPATVAQLSTATLTVQGNYLSELTVRGDVSNGGSITATLFDWGTNNSGTHNLSGSGQWQFGNLNLTGTTLIGSDMTFDGGAVRINLGATLNTQGNNLTINSTSFDNLATLNIGTGNLTFTGSDHFFASGADNSGNQVGQTLGTGTIIINPSGVSPTFGNNNQFQPSLRFASGTINSCCIFVGGNLTVDQGATLNITGTSTVNGNVKVNGVVTGSGSPTFIFNGQSFTNNGSFFTGFLTFNNSGAPRSQSIAGTGSWPAATSFSIGGGTGSTSSTTLMNNVTLNHGQFSIGQSSVLDLQNFTLTYTGRSISYSGQVAGTGVFKMSPSSGAANIIGAGVGTISSGLEIATGTVTASGTVSGPLVVDSGATLTGGFGIVARSDVTINGTVSNTGIRYFLGNVFVNNGSVVDTFVDFTGLGSPVTQQLAGTGTWGGTSARLFIGSDSTTTLASDVTYAGPTFYLDGRLKTGAFTFSLPCTTAWQGGGDIVGNVRRTNLGACAGAVAFGNPFNTIQFTSGTAPTEVTVNTLLASPPSFGNAVRRSYAINAVGGTGWTATLRLHYLDSELNGNNESTLQLYRNNGTTWNAQGATARDTTNNWVEYAGVTQFSPWTLSSLTPSAANGTVDGRIVDRNGTPISGATINLSGTQSRKTITDSNGNYYFLDVETNGFYTVTPARANYTFSPPNRSFSLLGVRTEASFTASANGDQTNAIDTTEFFVRQQYLDFLGREPDPPGFSGWTSTINNCTGDTTQCDRIHVSQLFFQAQEFQERGYFVYRFYPVAFGRKPDYAEFVPDLASVSGFLDNNQLEAAKVAFIANFMARPAFVSTYNSLTNQQYVDALLNTAGVTLASRQAMIDGLNNATLTRAQVLRQIVESTEVSTKYNHQAYAVMEYFGYLRRQPDAFYLDWIRVLDQTNDPRGMVTGFVNSLEYRQRFGP
jgi:hypothetical protein